MLGIIIWYKDSKICKLNATIQLAMNDNLKNDRSRII